ncbi:MAG: hypothetical protein IT359_07715 [Gemmatimonadaceae bacterium]|nr:hypothetical protein [Gemmatimonadaceae bacterium]
MMRYIKTLRFLGVASLLAAGACADLDVTNPNQPDIKRALASGEDVKNIAISTVNSWYLSMTDVEPWLMMSVTADMGTANFGNFGMRFNNLEPRAAYVNNSAGGDRAVTENPWDGYYGTLGAANDVLIAIANNVEVPNGETAKYKALAAFSQAASLTDLALLFDQAFVVDETSTGQTPAFKKYTEVATTALAKWDALIASLNGTSYTYEPTVLPLSAGVLSSSILNRLSNTMAARLLAYTPRTAADNATVNWAKVVSYAEKGITGTTGTPIDINVVGDDCNNWCSLFVYYNNEPTWLRVDMRLINVMDPNSPSKYTGTMPPAGTSADARFASDFQYHGAVIGDPARGLFMQSPYSHKRYRFHARTSPTSGEGPAPLILGAENDLLWAEGLIRSNGDLAKAATLINKTRVGRGNLPAATAADGAASLITKLNYERQVELFNTSGIELYDARRTDRLQAGTLRHLPVPAKELEILRLPIYTFGGVGLPDKYVGEEFGRALDQALGVAREDIAAMRRKLRTGTTMKIEK